MEYDKAASVGIAAESGSGICTMSVSVMCIFGGTIVTGDDTGMSMLLCDKHVDLGHHHIIMFTPFYTQYVQGVFCHWSGQIVGHGVDH